MHKDRYGLALSTSSAEAVDAYVTGVDLLLSANAGAAGAFDRAIAADPGFALAHAGRARVHQLHGEGPPARAAIGRAEGRVAAATPRERAHVAMLALLIAGRGADALTAAREHLANWPRDAMVLAPCTAVFGLIAFSGRREYERELALLLDGLAAAYGDDWWFLAVRAFALSECGRLREARALIERALALHPRNANAAHFHVHLLYEEGGVEEGLAFLDAWLPAYPRAATLHCHLNWHRALWLRETGRDAEAWEVYRVHVRPGASWGPPLNALTDSASFLWRAELAGDRRERGEWQRVADYVPNVVAAPGLAFADVHALLAFAAVDDTERFAAWRGRLLALVEAGTLAAGGIVPALGDAWRASVVGDWSRAAAILEPLLDEHARIGGSRAQRDLVEHTFFVAALRSGRSVERQRVSGATRRAPRIPASLRRASSP